MTGFHYRPKKVGEFQSEQHKNMDTLLTTADSFPPHPEINKTIFTADVLLAWRSPKIPHYVKNEWEWAS